MTQQGKCEQKAIIQLHHTTSCQSVFPVIKLPSRRKTYFSGGQNRPFGLNSLSGVVKAHRWAGLAGRGPPNPHILLGCVWAFWVREWNLFACIRKGRVSLANILGLGQAWQRTCAGCACCNAHSSSGGTGPVPSMQYVYHSTPPLRAESLS